MTPADGVLFHLTGRGSSLHEICQERSGRGLPANVLTCYGNTERISLQTPKGGMTLRWTGTQLETHQGKPLRLTQPIIDQLVEAMTVARADDYEYKSAAEIQDGDREGWTFAGDIEEVGEGGAAIYRRLIRPGMSASIWFSASDLVR